MTEYRSLFNETTTDTDTLNVGDLTVTDSMTITGATLTLDQVDNTTIQYTNNEFSVKDLGISEGKLADLSVGTAKLQNQTVTTAKIADLNITEGKLADLSVGTAKLQNQTVTTDKIADLGITEGKLATSSVTTTKVGDLNITEGKLANPSVSSIKIVNDAVTTSKILDLNVTEGKLATDSVSTNKIQDGAVTDSKITSVDATKITGTFGTINVTDLIAALAELTRLGVIQGKLGVSSGTGNFFAGVNANDVCIGTTGTNRLQLGINMDTGTATPHITMGSTFTNYNAGLNTFTSTTQENGYAGSAISTQGGVYAAKNIKTGGDLSAVGTANVDTVQSITTNADLVLKGNGTGKVSAQDFLGVNTSSSIDRPLSIKGDTSTNEWISFQSPAAGTKWNLGGGNGASTGNAFSLSETGVANNRLFVNPGGNVGIGNTNNTYKLDISGTGRYTGALQCDSTVNTTGDITSSTNKSDGYAWLDSGESNYANGMIMRRLTTNSYCLDNNSVNGTWYISWSLNKIGSRTTASKGIKIKSFVLAYYVTVANLVSANCSYSTTSFSDNAIPFTTTVTPTGSFTTTFDASNIRYREFTVSSPVFMNTTSDRHSVEFAFETTGSGNIRIVGLTVKYDLNEL